MQTAFVVEPNSPNQILNAISELLSDQQKRNSLVENAFKIVQQYDWKNVGQKYLEIYQNLYNKADN